ncbi:MAG: response regulator transcription factor [Trebonia sp.]
MGAELFITPKTASVHVSNILAKLGAASRTEAAAIAYREGISRSLGCSSRCLSRSAAAGCVARGSGQRTTSRWPGRRG